MSIRTCVLALAVTAVSFAQPSRPAPSPNDAVVSPEIHSDRSVTFRIYAPKAVAVTLRGEWMQNSRRDPKNPSMKLGSRSGGVSLVDISGPDAEFHANSGTAARRRNTELFEADLLKDVMPLIEKSYRASAKREDRAIVGLSMGGGQSLNVGLRNLDRFAWIGVFSSGIGNTGSSSEEFEKEYAAVLQDSAKTNKQLRIFWVGCDKTDFVMKSNRALLDVLNKHQIKHTYDESEGGHTWTNWRQYLNTVAPQLFRGPTS